MRPPIKPIGGRMPDEAKKMFDDRDRAQGTICAPYVGENAKVFHPIPTPWMDVRGNYHDPCTYTHLFVKNPNRTRPTRAEIRAAKKVAQEQALKT